MLNLDIDGKTVVDFIQVEKTHLKKEATPTENNSFSEQNDRDEDKKNR